MCQKLSLFKMKNQEQERNPSSRILDHVFLFRDLVDPQSYVHLDTFRIQLSRLDIIPIDDHTLLHSLLQLVPSIVFQQERL
jgi:hypothetical protein